MAQGLYSCVAESTERHREDSSHLHRNIRRAWRRQFLRPCAEFDRPLKLLSKLVVLFSWFNPQQLRNVVSVNVAALIFENTNPVVDRPALHIQRLRNIVRPVDSIAQNIFHGGC